MRRSGAAETAQILVGTGRTEAFSDGVFAIAATLLVLDLREPAGTGGLWRGLLAQWPSFAAYAVSFATIGIIWLNHHMLLRQLRVLDRRLLQLNLLLLMLVAFIPFPTALLARDVLAGQNDSRVAAAIYGMTMLVMGVIFTSLWHLVSHRERLYADGVTREHALAAARRSRNGPVAYAAATALSAVSAPAALAAYAAVAIYFALPFRDRARSGPGGQDGTVSS